MKMKKIAKDRTGKVLDEGDIIHCGEFLCVVRAIVQPNREEFPYIRISRVMTDWKGKVVGVDQATLYFDDYRLCRNVDPATLRDDVPAHKRIKQIREQIAIRKS